MQVSSLANLCERWQISPLDLFNLPIPTYFMLGVEIDRIDRESEKKVKGKKSRRII